MSAIHKGFVCKAAKLSDKVTRAFPDSGKIHVEESHADIPMPMREVALTPIRTHWDIQQNPFVHLNDTAESCSNLQACISLPQSCPMAAPWIEWREARRVPCTPCLPQRRGRS